jgi:hypothetical protein
MQPPPQDPTNPPSGQSSPYARSDQPSFAPLPSSPEYAPILSPVSSDYPSERRYYGEPPRSDGPVTRQPADRDKVIDGPPNLPGPSSPWRTLALVLLVTAVIFAGMTALLLTHRSVPLVEIGGSTSIATPVGSTPTISGTPTEVTSTTTSTNNYSAALPGLGCDTNGGTWTEQGLDGISCPNSTGTELVINASGTRGYLYLQLPNDRAFLSSNTISVTSTLGDNANGYQTKCVGLAEQDVNTGYSAEYCNNGQWFIASISSGGVILQTLHKSVTTTMTTVEISLTFQKTTLSFSVDNNIVDTIGISSIQPAKVAIVYDCVGYGAGSTIGGNYLLVSGFSYTTLSS